MKAIKWLYPGMKIKRWLLLSLIGVLLFTLGFILIINPYIPAGIAKDIDTFTGSPLISFFVYLTIILGGLFCMIFGIKQWFSSIYRVINPNEKKKLVEIIYEKRHLEQGIKIASLGGGTGLSTLLRGLKEYTSNIVAIVTVSDDGGSSGRLRQQLGILPPGDIRSCLVALADEESLMSELFQYRFKNGEGLEGHSFGNLFVAAMNSITGEFDEAVQRSSKILAVRGKVLPATLTPVTLSAILKDGSIVSGESQFSTITSTIESVHLSPKDCKPQKEIIAYLSEADIIVIGPGSLYTSIMPNLLIEEIAKAIKNSRAVKIYVCNIMTQPGETDRYSASDHVNNIFKQVGNGLFDYILINNAAIPKNTLLKYKAKRSYPVKIDHKILEQMGVKPILSDFLDKGDLSRHNSKKLADEIIKIFNETKSQ